MIDNERENINLMRGRNEDLLYTMLPSHVAILLMDGKLISKSAGGSSKYYSQNHKSVGVMFASFPKFYEIYSENSGNHNGLDCVKTLHEIISKFDSV